MSSKYNEQYKNICNLITSHNSRSSITDFKQRLKSSLDTGLDINYASSTEMPLLWHAIYPSHARERLVPILLDAGANPNVIDADGRNALIYTIYNNVSEPIIREILKKTENLNLQDNNGWIAFSMACDKFRSAPAANNQFKHIAKLLLEAGADPFLDSRWEKPWGWEVGIRRIKEIENLILQHQLAKEAQPKTIETYEYEI